MLVMLTPQISSCIWFASTHELRAELGGWVMELWSIVYIRPVSNPNCSYCLTQARWYMSAVFVNRVPLESCATDTMRYFPKLRPSVFC